MQVITPYGPKNGAEIQLFDDLVFAIDNSRYPTANVDGFLDIWLPCVEEGLDPMEANSRVYNHPDINRFLPRFAERVAAGKKIAAAYQQELTYLKFVLKGACACCGTPDVSMQFSPVQARSALRKPDRPQPPRPIRELAKAEYIVLCEKCIDLRERDSHKIFQEELDAKRLADEPARLERERKRAIEQEAIEMQQRQDELAAASVHLFITISGHLDDLEAFDEQCSDMIRANYVAWGSPMLHQERMEIIQAFQYVENPTRLSAAKEKKPEPYSKSHRYQGSRERGQM